MWCDANLNGDERGGSDSDECAEPERPQVDADDGGDDIDEPVGQERGYPKMGIIVSQSMDIYIKVRIIGDYLRNMM